MIEIRNNLSRGMCLNLKNNKTLRLSSYETKEIKESEVSDEVKSNERESYISLRAIEKPVPKKAKGEEKPKEVAKKSASKVKIKGEVKNG